MKVVSWCAACLIALVSAPALASFPYSKIIVTYDADKKVHDNFAANGNGDVVFQMIDTSLPVASGYQARIGGNIPITVIGSNYAAAVQGPVSISPAGDVTFQSYNPGTPEHGAFKTTGGGQPLTLTGNPFGKAAGAPSMNGNGDVVFLSMEATGPALNVRTAGGITGTLPTSFASGIGRPAMNNGFTVASSGTFADGKQGLAVGRVGGGTTITITGDWTRLTSSQPQITNNGSVLFSVQGDPPQGQATGRRQHMLAMPEPGGTGYAVVPIGDVDEDCDSDLNDDLSVVSVDGEKLKVYIADSNNNRGSLPTWQQLTLLTVGDTFDGSTITSLRIGDGSMMPDNSVVFHATLANGGSGIYQIVVPEPASISFVAASLLAVRRRR